MLLTARDCTAGVTPFDPLWHLLRPVHGLRGGGGAAGQCRAVQGGGQCRDEMTPLGPGLPVLGESSRPYRDEMTPEEVKDDTEDTKKNISKSCHHRNLIFALGSSVWLRGKAGMGLDSAV